MIYPLRPKNAISPQFIAGAIPDSWLIQAKFDGKNMLCQTNSLEWWTRHKEKREVSFDMPISGNYLLNGEYMTTMKDEKGKPFNGGFILFDVLMQDNKQMIGTGILERYHLLRSLAAWEKYNEYLYVHPDNANLYLVRNLRISQREVMERIFTLPEDGKQFYIEGFIFKNPHQKLTFPTSELANSAGLIKCRVPSKNYQF